MYIYIYIYIVRISKGVGVRTIEKLIDTEMYFDILGELEWFEKPTATAGKVSAGEGRNLCLGMLP